MTEHRGICWECIHWPVCKYREQFQQIHDHPALIIVKCKYNTKPCEINKSMLLPEKEVEVEA